jgi:conjugal transfer pilus assembly protein TraB
MERLKEIWEDLSPNAKRHISIGVGVFALVALMAVFVTGGEQINSYQSGNNEAKKAITPLVGDDIKGVSIERVQGEIARLNAKLRASGEEVKALRRELKAQAERQKQQGSATQGRLSEDRIQAMIEQAIKEHDAVKQVSPTNDDGGVKVTTTKDNSRPESVDLSRSTREGDVAVVKTPRADGNPFERVPPARYRNNGTQSASPTGQHGGTAGERKGSHKLAIRTIEPTKEDIASITGQETKVPYIPMGSIITGVMLTGLDAGTGQQARKNPYPALIRVKKDAVLPNRFQQDVRECFILASGYGELSSERVHLRSEGISCVKDDGTPIEVKAAMYAVGEDGKAGLRGRLVNKQGQLLAKSLTAGVLSGFSSVFNQQAVPTISLTPGTNTPFQQAFSKEAVQSGLVQGTSSALDRLAQFYIDQADQIFPVLEVDAQRRVTFVVTSGFGLEGMGGAGSAANSAKNE